MMFLYQEARSTKMYSLHDRLGKETDPFADLPRCSNSPWSLKTQNPKDLIFADPSI